METNTLRSLTAEALTIEQKLLESGGEITPEIEADLSLNDENMAIKIDGYALMLGRMDQMIEYHKQLMTQHAAHIATIEKAKEWMLSNLLGTAERLQRDSLNGNEWVVKARTNPPKVEITDETLISDDFKVTKTTQTIDKKKIGDGLKLGIQIPGTRLVQTKRVEVKTRVELLKD